MDEVIPRGRRDHFGRLLGFKNGDPIRRWCREAESDEAPTATGRRSPLDEVCRLLDMSLVVNPDGPGIIAAFIDEYATDLQRTHQRGEFNERETVRGLSQRFTDAVDALLGGELKPSDIKTLRDLNLYVEAKIEQASAAMMKRSPELERIRIAGRKAR